jgi:hypothetical protein
MISTQLPSPWHSTLALFALVIAACGSPTGSERGACYPNGTCDPGLACLSDRCVRRADDAATSDSVAADAQLDVQSDMVMGVPTTRPDGSDANDTINRDNGLCPGPELPPPGEVELARIPTNFDRTPLINTGLPLPASAAPDVVGAFRFICNASHLGYDDPIVFPCQPGRSHLHQFFGNTLTDSYSNYASLRTTGESTCENALNRSAYWVPAMMNGHGRVVRPDFVAVYYKRRPESDPECMRSGIACVPIPRGLRFVFGFNLLDPSAAPTGEGYFNCQGPTAEPGHYRDIVEAATHCPTGNQLGMVISAPSCWNGRDLDSPDHRSHVAYASYGTWGYLRCPDTHPYIIPTFTLGVWYTTDDDLDRSGTWTEGVSNTWYLSSDMSTDGSMIRPGTSLHADWWGAWDDEVLQTWHAHCINEMLNCAAGVLGDGTQLRRYSGFTWTANPRVVDPPPRP